MVPCAVPWLSPLANRLILCLLYFLSALTPAHADRTETIAEISALVRSEALVPLPLSTLRADTVEGLVSALRQYDPYLSYTPRPSVSIDETGDVQSLGMSLSALQRPYLVMPWRSGAAYRAGFTDAAYLLAINGRPVGSLDLAAISETIRSTTDMVSLTVASESMTPTFDVHPRRDENPFSEVEVSARHCALFIRLHNFVAGETHRKLASAVTPPELLYDTIVIDLRLNPGGSFYEALDSASLFLPAGLPLASTRDRRDRGNDLVSLANEPKIVDVPVALLISGHTASAAEAFVRALRFHDRALVLGRQSFGKCLSQRRFRLQDGSLLTLTNLEILGPEGRACDGRGMVPDHEVSATELLSTDQLIRQSRAILGYPPCESFTPAQEESDQRRALQ